MQVFPLVCACMWRCVCVPFLPGVVVLKCVNMNKCYIYSFSFFCHIWFYWRGPMIIVIATCAYSSDHCTQWLVGMIYSGCWRTTLLQALLQVCDVGVVVVVVVSTMAVLLRALICCSHPYTAVTKWYSQQQHSGLHVLSEHFLSVLFL